MPATQSSSTSAESQLLQLDLLGLVLRKFWVILFVTCVGIGLGILLYFKAPRTYESQALLFVKDRNPVNIGNDEETAFTEDSPVQEYIDKMASGKVLLPAIDEAQIAEMESMQDVDNVLKQLRERLVIKPADPKSNHGTIRVAYQSPIQSECQTVVAAVCASFTEYMLNSTSGTGNEMDRLVNQLSSNLDTQYEELSAEIVRLKSAPSLVWRDQKAFNPHQLQLAKLQDELDLLRREKTKIEARVQNIQQSIDRGDSTNRDALLMEVLSEINEGSLGAYVTTHNEYVQLKIEEQKLLNQYGSDHPTMVALRNQIEMVDQLRMQELSALRGDTDGNGPPDFISIFLANLQSRLEVMETEEQAIVDSMNQEREQAAEVVTTLEQLETAEKKRAVMELAMTAATDRLREINLLQEYQWYEIEMLDEPSTAEQVAPSLLLCGAAGVFIGSLFGFGLALLIELAEKRVHSSDEVARVFGNRVVAHVQSFNGRRGSKEFPQIGGELVSLHRPNSAPSEAYRAIRTSVFFKARESGLRTIQVTSPVPGDGKSTTAANLAHVIAQSGRKTVLVDCDFRRPVVHRIFGLKNEAGMSNAIIGELSLAQATQSTEIPNLGIVTSGPAGGNPAELLTSDRFKNLLTELEQEFDFVIVDSPPMMAVTDPSIIASNVDGVYVVTRIRNGVRVNARQSREMLESVDAKVLGVVINGVEKKSTMSYSYDAGYSYSRYGRAYQASSSVPSSTNPSPTDSSALASQISEPV